MLKKYEALCRGESRDFISQNPSLKCTLSTRANNPYFMIGPVKEEQLHVDPPLWVFHDVIYNSEVSIRIYYHIIKYSDKYSSFVFIYR